MSEVPLYQVRGVVPAGRAFAEAVHRVYPPPSTQHCWGTSLIRKTLSLGPYGRDMPRALWWPYGGGLFLMSEVPLYQVRGVVPAGGAFAEAVRSVPPLQGCLAHKKCPPP